MDDPQRQLLVAQLERVIAETDEAAHTIVSRIARVDACGDAMTATLRSAMDAFEGLRGDTSERAVGEKLAEHARKHAEDKAAFESRAKELEAKLGALETSGLAVSRVAKESHIMAVNSKIEVARLGRAASGFGVIADEMMRISRASREAATEIEQSVHLTSTVLHEQIALQRNESSALDEIVARQQSLLEAYGALRATFEGAIGRLEQASREMASSVADALAAVQFQDVVRQQLEHVIEGLAGGDTERLAARYTMHAEREVHDQVRGTELAKQDVGAKIELF